MGEGVGANEEGKEPTVMGVYLLNCPGNSAGRALT